MFDDMQKKRQKKKKKKTSSRKPTIAHLTVKKIQSPDKRK